MAGLGPNTTYSFEVAFQATGKDEEENEIVETGEGLGCLDVTTEKTLVGVDASREKCS